MVKSNIQVRREKNKYKLENQKLLIKLKMMEISFEQINNSRNDMIHQLANTETIINNAIEYAESVASVYEPKIIRILRGEDNCQNQK